jgi:hypothetical protein
MGRYLSESVPESIVTAVPEAGHLWVLVHLKEVLEALKWRAFEIDSLIE